MYAKNFIFRRAMLALVLLVRIITIYYNIHVLLALLEGEATDMSFRCIVLLTSK